MQFSHIVDFMIMMPLGPQLMRMFEITPKQFGLLVSSYTFAASLSGFLAAFFVDRFDRKKTVLFFYSGFALATLLCALSPNYYSLLVTRAMTGAFGGILGSLIFAIVGDSIEAARRGSAMGIVMGAFSIASIFGVPFSLYLANTFSWHAPFFFLGLVSLLIVGVAGKQLPAVNAHLQKGMKHDSPVQTLFRVATDSNQLLALCFLFLLVMGQFTVIPFMSPSFVANGGLSEAQLPLIYLFGGVVSMVTSPLVGRAADKYGKKRVFTIGALGSIIPLYLITNMGPSSVYYLIPVSCLFFLGMGARMVPAMSMVTSTVKMQYRGSFMSLSSSTQQMSAAFASFIAGLIVVKSETGTLENYDIVGYIAIIGTILAVLAARMMKSVEAHGE